MMKAILPGSLLACGLTLFLTGCGTMKVTEHNAQSARSCAQHAEKNGVTIGIQPMTTKAAIKETFRVDLRDKGLLPILVVAENRNPSASFILAKQNIAVLDEKTGVARASQRTNVTSETAGNATAIAGASLLAATSLAGAPLLIAGLKMASDATVIQHNLADKELYSRTLGPNETAHGFIYFHFPKETPPVGNYHVTIDLQNSATSEITPFTFPVNLDLSRP